MKNTTNEIEFQFSNHLQLVNEAEKKGNQNYLELKIKKEKILENSDFFVTQTERIENLSENSLVRRLMLSVDGSSQQIFGAGQIIYVPLSIARVYLHSPMFNTELKNIPYFEEIRIIDEEGHAKVEKNENFVKFYGEFKEDIKKVEQSVQSNINFLMLKYESEAINKIANEVEQELIEPPSLLFLDGPIIDPPIDSLISLIKLRAKALKKLLGFGTIIIGVTKRVFQKNYLSHLKNTEEKEVFNLFNDDFDLFNGIFTQLNLKLPIRSQFFNMDSIMCSKRSKSYTEWMRYKKEGINFQSCYYLNALGMRVIKLDILTPDDFKNYSEILDAVNKLTYPRFSIPLPVYLAHTYANIGFETVDLLKKIILSKTASVDPKLFLTNPPIDMYDII